MIYTLGGEKQCYFCDETSEECSADIFGERVHCQMEDPTKPHYGDECAVGHTGKIKIGVICGIGVFNINEL